MAEASPSTDRFVFSSSIAAEAWHPDKDPMAYEWWYFDALSDDGNEAVVIVFLDNFVYSPRYNSSSRSNGRVRGKRFPAVSFTYFSGGEIKYRVEHEFTADDFEADGTRLRCRIGNCGFRFDKASYGSGFLISVDLPLSKDRHLRANLEWLAVEADLLAGTAACPKAAHSWNMAMPRADVSGKITVEDDRRKTTDVHSFRGTGYHDHNLDNRWLAKTVREWHWGRAHFVDSTIAFCRYAENGDDAAQTRLLLIREGKLETLEAVVDEAEHVRDKFGLRYPTRLSLVGADGSRLEARTLKVVDSSFYHLRFLSTMDLTLDGRSHSTTGITEFIAPRALKYRWLSWLSRFRSGRGA